MEIYFGIYVIFGKNNQGETMIEGATSPEGAPGRLVGLL
jgi:hypothetical protein